MTIEEKDELIAGKKKRVTVTLEPDLYVNLLYWSERLGMSINEYLKECIENDISFRNGDHSNLADAFAYKMNEIISNQEAQTAESKLMRQSIYDMIKVITVFTQGDNTISNLLTEDDDDEGE